MDDNLLKEKADRLKVYLKSTANAPKAVYVGARKNNIYVYTKRKFKGYVPEVWEGLEVYHHHNGSAKITRLARDC